MTKIIVFSDLHGQISNKLTQWFFNHPGDILAFAGDIQKNHFDYGEGFLYWLNELPYTHKIITFGNILPITVMIAECDNLMSIG